MSVSTLLLFLLLTPVVALCIVFVVGVMLPELIGREDANEQEHH